MNFITVSKMDEVFPHVLETVPIPSVTTEQEIELQKLGQPKAGVLDTAKDQ